MLNYRKIYDNLVSKAKLRGLDKNKFNSYCEIHHIKPRSIGGSDSIDNLVMLTGREHYIAHMLLWKMFPENKSLVYAANMMCNRFGEYVNSRLYEKLKQEFSRAVSDNNRGKKYKDLTGQRFERLTVLKLSHIQERITKKGTTSRTAVWECVCDCGNNLITYGNSLTTGNTKSCGCLSIDRGRSQTGENNPFFGKKHTEETKRKFKNRKRRVGKDSPNFGRSMSKETREKLSRSLKGKKWSDKRRMSYVPIRGENHHMYGKKPSDETIEKFRKTMAEKDLRAWETTGTHTEESLDKWAMCDYYYDLWKESGELALRRFTKFFNYINNDDVSLAFFTNPIVRFREGWIPREDPKWIEFNKNRMGQNE